MLRLLCLPFCVRIQQFCAEPTQQLQKPIYTDFVISFLIGRSLIAKEDRTDFSVFMGLLVSVSSHEYKMYSQLKQKQADGYQERLNIQRDVGIILLEGLRQIYFHYFTIYSQKQIMQLLKSILHPINPQLNVIADQHHVTLTFDSTRISEALLYLKGPIQIRMSDSEWYQFPENSQIQPVYISGEQKGNISSLKIHFKGSTNTQLVLEGKGIVENMKIYSEIKRMLPHKGFNEYFAPMKRLGRGTFATVYLIQHRITKREYAAKVFSRQGQKIEFKGKEALQNQIKVLQEVDHPNIIAYEGVYQTDNLIYLVTEYLQGGTLEETIYSKCLHSGDLVLKIIGDVLRGLSYLNSKGIMHRDIKPQNILHRLSDDKWVISDFGLAAKSCSNYLYDKCGTMGYIAPQIMQLKTDHKYSQECDVYSLGIIAYTLIVGSLPFRVQSQNFFDKKIVWELFDKPECSKIQPEVLKFLKQLLENNPKHRVTPEKALNSSFFTDKQVVTSIKEFHDRRKQERYQRILKMANC